MVNYIGEVHTKQEPDFTLKMQTRDRDNDNNKQAAEEKRDLDLENIAGNLFIAEYQVDKLRTRLVD